MKPFWMAALSFGMGLVLVGAEEAPTPKTSLTYEDRVGTTGHSLVLEGKTYGPYREVFAASSTSGTALAFSVFKKDRLYVLASGKETGPLPAGFEIDRLQISDDGKVWILTATRASTVEDEPPQTLVWVNGKSYGPYSELTTIDYAEAGGAWIAAVRTTEEEADVLVTGKPQGPFYLVDHAWITPDGKGWGYAISDSEAAVTVITSEKIWTGVVVGNFSNLYPREPHWGYALRFATGADHIVVDGQTYTGFRGFQGLILTPSGNHWAFGAQKLTATGEVPAVVIDGKEYWGEAVVWSRLGRQESFTWTVREGTKVGIQTLKLD